LNVPADAYRTADGRIMIALVREEQFARFAAALGRPDLAADPCLAGFAARARHARPLGEIVGAILRNNATARWLGRLRAADLPARPDQRLRRLWLADPDIVVIGGAVAVSRSLWIICARRQLPAFRPRPLRRCRRRP
jgi:crotonobetainyl-CoA:carnitine CoA-transferase CaiB-like acyl-CoA transferase